MAIEIFWGSGSPYSWRVLLFAEAKGIPYESRLLQFSKREHKTPEFLAMNPRGKLPVLREGAAVVCESLAILTYLERTKAEPAMFGRSPLESAHVVQALSEFVAYVEPAVEDLTLPLYFGRWKDEGDKVRRAVAALPDELGRLEATLARQPYLVGDTLSAADIVAFPHVMAIDRAAGRPGAETFAITFAPVGDKYPAIGAWMKRIQALPGYERTYPPHWRQS